MNSGHFHNTYTNTPAFWQAAEDAFRGIQVIRLHPRAKMAELEERVRAEFPLCEFHWPRPDPGSESEHRGDCWLLFPGAGDATRALAVLAGWKFVTWHIKAQRARREKPLSPLPSPPEPAMATAPELPVAFVNTTTGDLTVMTQITQGPGGYQMSANSGIETSSARMSYLLDWQKWGTKESP